MSRSDDNSRNAVALRERAALQALYASLEHMSQLLCQCSLAECVRKCHHNGDNDNDDNGGGSGDARAHSSTAAAACDDGDGAAHNVTPFAQQQHSDTTTRKAVADAAVQVDNVTATAATSSLPLYDATARGMPSTAAAAAATATVTSDACAEQQQQQQQQHTTSSSPASMRVTAGCAIPYTYYGTQHKSHNEGDAVAAVCASPSTRSRSHHDSRRYITDNNSSNKDGDNGMPVARSSYFDTPASCNVAARRRGQHSRATTLLWSQQHLAAAALPSRDTSTT